MPDFSPRCAVEEYPAWSEEDLIPIVQFWLNDRLDLLGKDDVVCRCFARVYLKMNEFQFFTLTNLRKTIEFFVKFAEEIRQRQKVGKRESPLDRDANDRFRCDRIVARRFSIEMANPNESFKRTNSWLLIWTERFFFSKRN